jgi:inhibitor of the pro-sigma K processing machinery
MDVIFAVIFIIIIAALIYYLAKKFMVLVINAVLGLVLLFFMNYLHVMSWVGKPDLGYSLATILICGVGGLPGVIILLLLNIIGVTV